jgi:hypothetical protein
MAPSGTRSTSEEREQRRAAERELAERAVEELRTSAGWQRWLGVRRHFHRYSLRNQILISMQRSGSHCLLGRGGFDIRSSGRGRPRWDWVSGLWSGSRAGSRCLLDCL